MKTLGRWVLYLAGMAIAVVLAMQLYFFLQIGWWVRHNPESTSFMQQQLSVLQEKNPRATLRHQWVPYQRISRHLKRAIIAAEDASFAEHQGVDWDALEKAYQKNLKKGRVVAGGSTITQQLAKNLFLSGNRSYLRKGQEFLITYMLEFWMDKERIFEIYLNVVEWGQFCRASGCRLGSAGKGVSKKSEKRPGGGGRFDHYPAVGEKPLSFR